MQYFVVRIFFDFTIVKHDGIIINIIRFRAEVSGMQATAAG